jgi:hypothetical protein
MIPPDVLATAYALVNRAGTICPEGVPCEHCQLARAIAAALLAERRAQAERDARIAETYIEPQAGDGAVVWFSAHGINIGAAIRQRAAEAEPAP